MQNVIVERQPLTDEEIHQAATEEWLGILSRLWIGVGKSPTSEQLTVYREMLGDIPLGLLERTVERAMREHRFANVPTIGNVWDAFLKELNLRPGMPVEQAVETWSERLFDACVLMR
jgi:hypothetical protein